MAEKHRLDLTEFLADDAEVKWAKGVLKIPSDVPFDLMVKTAKYGNLEGLNEDKMREMRDLVSDILKTRNDADNVNAFIEGIGEKDDGISWQNFMRLVKFMFDFINAASEDKNQVKKKNS